VGGAEFAVFEMAGRQPARALRHDHSAGLGNRLQARGKVRRFADDGLSFRRTLGDQVADHDQAGCDADPGLERRRCGRLQPRNCGDDVEAGPHRALGVVLMGVRITEIDQKPIAQEMRDESVIV
jgi:hypothetical protein